MLPAQEEVVEETRHGTMHGTAQEKNEAQHKTCNVSSIHQ